MQRADEGSDCHPPYLFPAYTSSIARAPEQQLVSLRSDWFESIRGPVFGRMRIAKGDNDLTAGHKGSPIGHRITLSGRVLDSDGRGVGGTLIELWQANAAGRYVDVADPKFFPLDPNFTGAGRTLTDSAGRFHFRTIKPAPYPGAPGLPFRPAHIHISIMGAGLTDRLVTQCYFEGDPHLRYDPIFLSVPDPRGRELLVAHMNEEATPGGAYDSAVAYDWDIVLRGPRATPIELSVER